MAAGLHTEFGQLRVKDHMTEFINLFWVDVVWHIWVNANSSLVFRLKSKRAGMLGRF